MQQQRSIPVEARASNDISRDWTVRCREFGSGAGVAVDAFEIIPTRPFYVFEKQTVPVQHG